MLSSTAASFISNPPVPYRSTTQELHSSSFVLYLPRRALIYWVADKQRHNLPSYRSYICRNRHHPHYRNYKHIISRSASIHTLTLSPRTLHHIKLLHGPPPLPHFSRLSTKTTTRRRRQVYKEGEEARFRICVKVQPILKARVKPFTTVYEGLEMASTFSSWNWPFEINE